jgi:competence protein CoiA
VKRGGFVLVAITENQERFVIDSTIPHTTLKRLREERQFYCPQCGEKLQLKIGTVKMPHFAHISISHCESYFSEGETIQHLQGKEQLFQLFRYLQIPVLLEPYIAELNQRPDLLINLNGYQYAIEFQCSPIKHQRFLERNSGYNQKNIQPIWIALTPVQKIKENGLQKITLPHQLQQFITSEKKAKYLMTYNPNTKQFLYISNLIHLKGISYLSKISPLPLLKQKFPFYIPRPFTEKEFSNVLNAYHNFINQFLKSRVLFSRKGVNDLFLRSVYELRIDLYQFPIFLGIPICGNEAFHVCAIEWQTELMYFIHLLGIKVHAINQKVIIDFLRWSKRACTSEAIQVVNRYVELLKDLSVEDMMSTVKEEQLEELLYRQFLATRGKY